MYAGPKIITDGLLFALDAANTKSYPSTGTTAYSLIGSSNSTLINGVGFDNNNGGSWDLDGSNDYITLPDSLTSLHGGTEASLVMWVKLDTNSYGSAQSGIIQLSGYTSTNGNLYWYSNGYTYLDIFRTDRVSQVWSNTVIDPRKWHMLTVTTTPGTNGWKAYLNNTLQKQVTGQSTVSVIDGLNGGLSLGRNSNSRVLKGNIATMKLYNKALSADEVAQNYNATKERFKI
jgi:hypothetical protein